MQDAGDYKKLISRKIACYNKIKTKEEALDWKTKIVALGILTAINYCIYEYFYTFLYAPKIIPMLNAWWRAG